MWINSWVYPDELLVLICVDDVLITTVNVLYIWYIYIYILHWFSSYPFRTINPVKCITKKINSPLIAEVSRVCGSLDWWSWRVKGACRRAVSSWVVVRWSFPCPKSGTIWSYHKGRFTTTLGDIVIYLFVFFVWENRRFVLKPPGGL